MAHVIVDRRKNDKGKSSVNRRKFIGRVRDQLKDSIKDTIRDGDLKELTGPGKKKVRISIRNLDEPWFHHDGSGINDMVRPGNDKFVPGDKIKRPEDGEGEGGPKGSPDGEGEDEFSFHLTKEEFLDMFFENCELPDLIKKNLAIVNEEELRRTGLTSDGAPATLNIERSMRRAKSRRFALRSAKRNKLVELEAELAELKEKIEAGDKSQETLDKHDEVEAKVLALKRQIAAVPFLDPIDLKYNHWSKVSLPTTQAVIFRVMDVSGSMMENMKELAKTFFILLQLFLERHYTHIEIVNVRYHSTASEATDQEFFYGTETGGTVTSTGLRLVQELIEERYPTSLWNIYIAHASDGDNFGHDNPDVEQILTTQLLPIVQYYAYVQINSSMSQAWIGHIHDPDNLWDLFEGLKGKYRNLDCALVEDSKDVYPVFIKLFERRPS